MAPNDPCFKMSILTSPQEHKPSPSPSTSKEFGKSTNTRHLSLEERKKALIENARRTYLEKHMKH